MSNENKTISQFELNLICEYFSNLERQGPGSPEATLKALSFIDNLTSESRIADIGCGTGGQTMELAQNTLGHITGLDLFPDFIDLFNRNAYTLGLSHRVKGVVGSMEDALPFERESLDLIWSEGAIYNIGFEQGLRRWREYLKQGGYIAVTEASWFTEQRPQEIHDFWMEAEPGIDTIPAKVAQIGHCGYVPVATFILPENCWTEHYYAPQVGVREMLLEKYAGNQAVIDFISFGRQEEELYHKYKAFYGYVFYIGKKI
ncbi:class I SAM-dependent methyltransferase [Bacteroides sp.]|uniref:class I SAM-dependent methyltransferase n=1 Tax=Bacteroides sp. TaxID=29523 RepID=UPI00260DDB28|nr:class I SAM-dependent methyltransferase [Bacteroides sp.]MDD3039537.1 class I SAM-dependent methyltransferase [Bacteroides sp.]